MSSQKCASFNSWNLYLTLHSKGDFAGMNEVTDLGMRLSWIIQMGPI
jgi:hypothetical protein